ncbi:hypothetical protein [[Lactobacillus] timonensis]|nr:hypothetical protein [[Lactobacillus] timonensis]
MPATSSLLPFLKQATIRTGLVSPTPAGGTPRRVATTYSITKTG